MTQIVLIVLKSTPGKPVELTAPIEEVVIQKDQDVALEVSVAEPETVSVVEEPEADVTFQLPAEPTPAKGMEGFKEVLLVW